MISTAVIILIIYFLIGGVALFFITKKQTEQQARTSRIKYFSYMIVVSITLAALYYSRYSALSLHIIIALIGATEVWRATVNHLKIRLLAGPIYIFIAICFCLYPIQDNLPIQSLWRIYFYVLVFDGFAQISGQLFKGKKLAPKISPDKSISGVIGGMIMCIVTHYLIEHNWSTALLWGAVFSLLALTGDLLASILKRKTGIKDYSNLIPGHGGILDRYDSYMFLAACIYMLLQLFWIALYFM